MFPLDSFASVFILQILAYNLYTTGATVVELLEDTRLVNYFYIFGVCFYFYSCKR